MSSEPVKPSVNAGKLWAGGGATAAVAALIAVAGILLGRGIFDIGVLAPKGDGAWGDASTGWYALGAAVAALAATGLVHVLILTTPRPMRFFGWVVGLATVSAMLAPYVTDAERAAKVYTSGLTMILGIAIGSLIAGVARSATTLVRPRPSYR
ncbi:hypothetical protein ACWT_3840 [Actinoplanes sp. SE50]|uniref:DUF6069 family protein n=1 Tax=unclassified Actinoplanes TaxID=2626549 RepID=UPI00023ECEA0|nr:MULTISPECIES: DUF6069 family protein [unclassified Actinoplanes]AEV84864.1 hypothetical protein ACPL_3969 [Actinoplanes sp. SE50/110]ATO83255.1 hypothetical protein ACWT_3840 [Actinoplanes sp. SE50]SLM00662.1 uncharacterized protein ACSP50_3895 [Actinoplanes sp. SE50/110]